MHHSLARPCVHTPQIWRCLQPAQPVRQLFELGSSRAATRYSLVLPQQIQICQMPSCFRRPAKSNHLMKQASRKNGKRVKTKKSKENRSVTSGIFTTASVHRSCLELVHTLQSRIQSVSVTCNNPQGYKRACIDGESSGVQNSGCEAYAL